MKNQVSLLIKFYCFAGLVTLSASVLAYKPPIGIPVPPFGIENSHTQYAGQSFSAGNFAYRDAGHGPYSHYVDNSSGASCRDLFNTYGTAKTPRCTIPDKIPPGSVIEIHGGPYKTLNLRGVKGTKNKPIFIRGASVDKKPVFNQAPGMIIKDAAYIILEYLKTDGSELSKDKPNGGIIISQPSHHIGLRYLESTNYPMPAFCKRRKAGCWFHSIWSLGSDRKYKTGETIENIVLYKNHIHKNGEFPPTYESGRHAITAGGGVKNLWVLENTLEYNAEDGIQIFWFRDKLHGPHAERVFIGRNLIHHNGENAIAIKQSHDVIVSENHVYGYSVTKFPHSGSDGTPIVLDNEGPNTNIWVINNRIHDVTTGIRSQSAGENFIIGNVLYNIHKEANQRAPTAPGVSNGVAIISFRGKSSMHIINNTIYDADGGIYAAGVNSKIWVQNNLISHIGLTSGVNTGYHMAIFSPQFTTLVNSHNRLYHSGPKSKKRLTRDINICANCLLEQDPKLINPASGDLHIAKDSPLINVGTESDVYAIFHKRFGLDIKKDIDNATLPYGGKFDIGADEYTGGAN